MLCLHLEKPLEIRYILEVLYDGEFSAAKCQDLGLMLGVKQHQILNIQSNHVGQVQAQLVGILEYWLRNNLNPSWRKLANALGKCGYGNLASTICGKEQSSGMKVL